MFIDLAQGSGAFLYAAFKRIMCLLQGQLGLSAGGDSREPFPKTYREQEESTELADHFFQECLIGGITDNDISIQTVKIIGDINDAAKKEADKPSENERPSFVMAHFALYANPPHIGHDDARDQSSHTL